MTLSEEARENHLKPKSTIKIKRKILKAYSANNNDIVSKQVSFNTRDLEKLLL